MCICVLFSVKILQTIKCQLWVPEERQYYLITNFRLGAAPYKSQTIRRRLKVVNVTAIPIHVSWHVFVDLNEAKRDFSVIFDMPDSELLGFSEELVKGQLILTNQYFGEASSTHFEV